MSSSDSVDSIFLQALQQPSDSERVAYLDEMCGDDSELRQLVERLIDAHHRAAGSFLERPAHGLEREPVLGQPKQSENADQAIDLDRKTIDAGLVATFGPDTAVVVGSKDHSVRKSLEKQLGKAPSVMLRDDPADSNLAENPRSKEIPQEPSDSRYQLHGEIARGGMGAIIKGRDTDLGRDLAIKVLLDSHKEKPEYIERFVEEAQIGGQLQHPGIVPVYELGQFGDRRPFFTMKLVKGETLAALLAKRKSPQEDLPKLLGIFEQVCQTMAYAHSKGVIHRDLKPANIMVGAFGEVQVMDWGLSKVLRLGGTADEKKSLKKHQDATGIQTRRSSGSDVVDSDVGSDTRHGSIMGTPAYMPPEQALGEVDLLDTRADVFGLGAILAEILTGSPPYVADRATKVFRMASRGKLDDCFERLAGSGSDKQLIDIAKLALAPEVDDRLTDAGELSQQITAYLEGVQDRLRQAELDKVEAQARSEEERRRRKLYLAIAGLLLLLACGWGISAVLFARQQQKFAIAQREAAVRANSRRLVAESEKAGQQFPIRRTLLALEAIDSLDGQVSTFSPEFEALLNSTIELGGDAFHSSRTGRRVEVSPNGRWLACGAKSLVVWDLWARERPPLSREMQFDFQSPRVSLFGFIDQDLLLAGVEGTLHLVDLSQSRANVAFSTEVIATQTTAVAVSPLRDLLAIGRADGKVLLWNLPTKDFKAPIRELDSLGIEFNTLVFSPDSGRLAASSGTAFPSKQMNGTENRILLWDLGSNTSQPSAILEKHAQPGFGPYSLAFSPEGRWLAASGNPVRVWDLESKGDIDNPILLNDLEDGAYKVAISPDGNWLATCQGIVTLRGLTDQGPESDSNVLLNECLGLWNMEISSDSRWLAVSSEGDRMAYLWNLDADKIEETLSPLRAHEYWVHDVTFSEDSSTVFTNSTDNSVRRWDLSLSNPTSDRLLQLNTDVVELVFSQATNSIIAGSADNKIRIWDFDNGHVTSLRAGLEEYIFDSNYPMKTSANGKWLVAGNGLEISVWDLTANNIQASRKSLVGHQEKVQSIDIDPNNRWVASIAWDWTLRLWDLDADDPSEEQIILPVSKGNYQGCIQASFSPGGKWLVDMTCDNKAGDLVDVWDFAKIKSLNEESETKPTHSLRLDGFANYFAISPDDKYFFASTPDATKCVLLDLKSEKVTEAVRYLGDGQKKGIAGSIIALPDNESFLTSGAFGKVRVWNSQTGQYFDLPRGHSMRVRAMAIDGKSTRVATASEDFTARVWDLEDTSAPPLVLQHPTVVTGVTISQNGRWVLTAAKNTIRIWDLDFDSAITRARNLVGRDLTEEEREQFIRPFSDLDSTGR